MKRNKRKNKYLLLLILLLGISLGYALISTTLKINGSAIVNKHTWDVYWGVPSVTTGSVSETAPTRGADSGDPANTKLTWSVTLDLPGDFYEFEVDAVNNGDIDAMITGINPTVSPALPTNPDYIKYTVTYVDGITPALKHKLAKKTGNTPTTERYKVRVYYDETVATAASVNAMTDATTYTFNLELTYGQATDEAINKPIKAWNLPDGRTKDNLQAGDEICGKASLGLDDQCFNFIRYDGNDVIMLAKYNLNVGSNAKGTATNKQDSDVKGAITGITTYGNVKYSQDYYWFDEDSWQFKPEYGQTPPIDVYDEENYSGAPGEDNYSVAYYVKEYKNILTNMGVPIKNARLLKHSETTDPSIGCVIDEYDFGDCPTDSFISNTSFWLGSNTGANQDEMWIIWGELGYIDSYFYYHDWDIGVRPVIVISKEYL